MTNFQFSLENGTQSMQNWQTLQIDPAYIFFLLVIYIYFYENDKIYTGHLWLVYVSINDLLDN